MPLKFFIDESYRDGGVFVMGGHIITEEAFANFSTEWSGLLPTHGCDRKDGKRHFKMSQMAYEGRMGNVPPFCEIVEKHAIALVSLMPRPAKAESRLSRAGLKLIGFSKGRRTFASVKFEYPYKRS